MCCLQEKTRLSLWSDLKGSASVRWIILICQATPPSTSWLARCNLSSGEEEQRCNVISAYVTTRVKTRSFLLLAGFNSLPRFRREIFWSRVWWKAFVFWFFTKKPSCLRGSSSFVHPSRLYGPVKTEQEINLHKWSLDLLIIFIDLNKSWSFARWLLLSYDTERIRKAHRYRKQWMSQKCSFVNSVLPFKMKINT